MKLEEWHAVLETRPATSRQIGALIRRLKHLGCEDRAERLAACAALLELGELASTKDLTMGQAGQLIRMLSQLDHAGDLRGAVANHRRGSAGRKRRVSLAALILRS